MSQMMDLEYRVRPADGEPEGLICLFHGRGADENDLFPLFDVFDPQKRFLGVTPRGPLTLGPGGAHWYVVKEVGYPDPATFDPTFELVATWLDGFVSAQDLSFDRVVLGGFSQGAVMSLALGLSANRPAPAAIAAFSGFLPTVEGLEYDFGRDTKVTIAHGTFDPIISVEFGRDAYARLQQAGMVVSYREYPLPHAIDPEFAHEVGGWITDLLVGPDRAPRWRPSR